MSEFFYMESWDLQAVVRGCTNEASTNIMDNPPSFFSPLSFEQDHDFLFSFPEICETTTVLDELEALYKPFYPGLQPVSPETIGSSSISVPEEVKAPKKQQRKQQPPVQSNIAATSNDTTRVVKSKRRKNQNKMVVQQVTAEDLSSDKWAWRKYGQKPIKGSPYPRSYYRCSSSKGCLARKQVEQDPSDPRFFILTYTAEHSHTQPTRRNSLAGITRNKSSTPKVVATDNPQMTTETVLSPTTPLMASIEDDFVQQENIKREEVQMLEDDESSETVMPPDIIFSDELFPSLEDMGALFLDQ